MIRSYYQSLSEDGFGYTVSVPTYSDKTITENGALGDPYEAAAKAGSIILQEAWIRMLITLLVDRVLIGKALRDHTFQIVVIHIDLKDEFLLITGRDLAEVSTHQFIVKIIR